MIEFTKEEALKRIKAIEDLITEYNSLLPANDVKRMTYNAIVNARDFWESD